METTKVLSCKYDQSHLITIPVKHTVYLRLFRSTVGVNYLIFIYLFFYQGTLTSLFISCKMSQVFFMLYLSESSQIVTGPSANVGTGLNICIA